MLTFNRFLHGLKFVMYTLLVKDHRSVLRLSKLTTAFGLEVVVKESW